MNRTAEISIVVRGEVISRKHFNTETEAERYKAVIRRWGVESRVIVSILTRFPAAQEDRYWLLPSRAS